MIWCVHNAPKPREAELASQAQVLSGQEPWQMTVPRAIQRQGECQLQLSKGFLGLQRGYENETKLTG